MTALDFHFKISKVFGGSYILQKYLKMRQFHVSPRCFITGLLIGFTLMFFYFVIKSKPKVDDVNIEAKCDDCLPSFVNLMHNYRTSPRFNLSACVIAKSMSTVLSNIMCFINRKKKYLTMNKTLTTRNAELE